eukprot:908919-Prorocentrum_minimum.AAC.1
MLLCAAPYLRFQEGFWRTFQVSGLRVTRVVSVVNLRRERDRQPGELGDAHAVGGQLHNKRRRPPEGSHALAPT